MKLYLDTNVYSHITSVGQAKAIRAFLDRNHHAVLLSQENLLEKLRVRDNVEREQSIRDMFAIASIMALNPAPYLQAQEVLAEVRRCRPSWLRMFPDTSQVSTFLSAHRQFFGYLRRNPDVIPPGLENYVETVENGITRSEQSQKSRREIYLNGYEMLRLLSPDENLKRTTDTYDTIELYGRGLNRSIWWNVVANRDATSRDYADFACPYLKVKEITPEDFAYFWLVDVQQQFVPRNQVMAVVEYFQAERKITHGNAMDVNHAQYSQDVDIFLTGDKGFWHALSRAQEHCPIRAIPILIDRGDPDPLTTVAAAIERVGNNALGRGRAAKIRS